MSGNFEISPASLRAGAQGMGRSAENLASAVQKLQGQVLGAGSPWGSDELGTMFGEAYTECTRAGLQALDHLAEVLGSVSSALSLTADNVEGTDRKAASGLDHTY